MSSLDNNLKFLVDILIILGVVRIDRATFGTPLYLATPGTIDELAGDFTEAVRTYSSASAVAADLLAGNITQAAADALTSGFSQPVHARQLAVGRIPGGNIQVTTITLGGTDPSDGDITDVVYDGIAVQNAASSDTVQDVVDSLHADLVIALANLATVTKDALAITITDLTGGSRAATAVTDSITLTIAAAITTASDPVDAQHKTVKVDGFTGAADETFTIDVDGHIASYVTVGGEEDDELVEALRALLDGGAADISATHTIFVDSGDLELLHIINKIGATPSDIKVSTDSASGTIALATIRAATDPGTLMDILFAANDSWYIFSPQARTDARGYLLDLAAWTEPADDRVRRMIGQSNEAGILTADPNSITEQLKEAGYSRSSVNYHGAATEEATGWIWNAMGLTIDLTRQQSSWNVLQPVGLTQPPLTDGQITILRAANAGFLGKLKGVAAFFEGRFASGLLYNEGTSQDFMVADLEEDYALMLLTRAQQLKAITYDVPGFNEVRSRGQGRLDILVDIGHITPTFDPVSTAQVSPIMELQAFTAEDLSALRVPVGFSAKIGRFVHQIGVRGELEPSS